LVVKQYTQLVKSRDSGDFGAFTVVPAVTPAPAIILLQEIFGVNAVVRRIAQQFAEKGYLVLAPDLYWRLRPGTEFDYTREGMQAAREFLERFDEGSGVRDIRDTAELARSMPESNGKVGAVGFCLGGKLAYKMAVEGGVDAAAGFYGVGIESELVAPDQLHCPLQLHFAGADRYVPPAAVAAITEALSGAADIFVYEDADHAFFNEVTTRMRQPSAWHVWSSSSPRR
jgi:carboxymethylenebutenolidase